MSTGCGVSRSLSVLPSDEEPPPPPQTDDPPAFRPADNAPYAYTGENQKPHALEGAPSAAGRLPAVSPGTTIGKTLAMATGRLDLIKQHTSLEVNRE
jgi:hypothetical protein